MRFSKVIGMSALSIFLGTSALMYAQEQQEKPKEDARPAETEKDRGKTAPAPDRQNGMSKPQDNHQQPTGKTPEQSEDRNVRGEDRSHQESGGMGHNNNQMNNSGQNGSGQRSQAQSGGNRGGGHIPDDKFRQSFGRQHTFVVNRPSSGGQPQFQYGGYSFNIVDAWPSDWSYSDQVYVDYVDGQYFLYDLAHPGVTVAIVVVM